MNFLLKTLFASAIPFLFAAGVAQATICSAKFAGNITVEISENYLITRKSGAQISKTELPVVGSFWRCNGMTVFPKQNLLFIDWHEGSAGTSVIFTRRALLAFSIVETGVEPRGTWTLEQSRQGGNGTTHDVERSYTLRENDGRIDVALSGVEHIFLDVR